MTERERNFDFDMDGNFRMQLAGAELEQYFGSESAEFSIFNLVGFSSEPVDELIAAVKAAETLLTTRRGARPRSQIREISVPQWFRNMHTIAYYDMYRYPDTLFSSWNA